jgi:hypothetical protein
MAHSGRGLFPVTAKQATQDIWGEGLYSCVYIPTQEYKNYSIACERSEQYQDSWINVYSADKVFIRKKT